jgi:hypothetical protein
LSSLTQCKSMRSWLSESLHTFCQFEFPATWVKEQSLGWSCFEQRPDEGVWACSTNSTVCALAQTALAIHQPPRESHQAFWH